MWDHFVTFATWWTLAQFGVLGLLVVIGIFSGTPFVTRDDYEVHGDASAYPKSLHNARRANHRETDQ